MKKNSVKSSLNTQQEGTKKVPSVVMRKCQACGKIQDRNEMIRILTDYKNGEKIINPNSMQFGRSIYICKNQTCLKIAIKKKRLKNLSDSQIEEIKSIITGFE